MVLWQLIIIQVLTFAVLVFLWRQFLYKQVTRSVGRMQQVYQQNLKREEELKKRRDATEQELKAKIDRHREQTERVKAAAEVDAQKVQEEILARAKQEGHRIVAQAEAQKERMRANLVSEMEDKALTLASDIIEHTFTAGVAQAIHHQLIDELIEEIGKFDGQLLAPDVETVEVGSPFPLTEAQRENLTRTLSLKLDQSVNISETSDQEIVAGMVIRLGSLVLDGSLDNKLEAALSYVRSGLSR
ncbi:MAG: F0F1 ATP synthase subunit delta [Candidatus Binatia bacterium]